MAENKKLTTVDQLKKLAERTKSESTALETKIKESIPKKTSDLNNDLGFQTASDIAEAINAKVATVYKPGGSYAFNSLPAAESGTLGFVYNVTDAFTTTADFIDGTGKTHPAGTNVAVVQVGDEYKYDVLAGFVDLTGYQQKETGKGLSTNDFTTEEKSKLDSMRADATKVEGSETNGNIKVDGQELPVYDIDADVATNAEVEAMLDEVFATKE